MTNTLGGSDYLGDRWTAFLFAGKEIGRTTITADDEKGDAEPKEHRAVYPRYQLHQLTGFGRRNRVEPLSPRANQRISLGSFLQ